MSDEQAFDDLKVFGLENRTQVVNRMEERINSFEEQLGAYPGPYDPLNGNVYIQWERKTLLWLGRVSERLACLQELNVMPPEQAQRLKIKAMALINRATEKTVMGQRF